MRFNVLLFPCGKCEVKYGKICWCEMTKKKLLLSLTEIAILPGERYCAYKSNFSKFLLGIFVKVKLSRYRPGEALGFPRS